MRALVVDDDEIVREIVSAALSAQGLRVTIVDTVVSALRAFQRASFQLLVADVNLPDGLGYDLVTQVRAIRDVPVIYLSGRDAVGDRLRAFETGADDYLVKPFDPAELVARVGAVLRRTSGAQATAARFIAHADWTLDFVRRELARADGALVALTRGEFDLLSALIQASPTPLDRQYLLEVVSSADATAGERTIDVMVSRIRTKLEAMAIGGMRIATIRGDGYRFEREG